jgi:hypothetical protein
MVFSPLVPDTVMVDAGWLTVTVDPGSDVEITTVVPDTVVVETDVCVVVTVVIVPLNVDK